MKKTELYSWIDDIYCVLRSTLSLNLLRLPIMEFQKKHMKCLWMLFSRLFSARVLIFHLWRITILQVCGCTYCACKFMCIASYWLPVTDLLHVCCVSLDVIMDMLGDRKMRKIVNSYYEGSGEPALVRKAVAEAYSKEQCYNEEVDGRGNLPEKLKKLR